MVCLLRELDLAGIEIPDPSDVVATVASLSNKNNQWHLRMHDSGGLALGLGQHNVDELLYPLKRSS